MTEHGLPSEGPLRSLSDVESDLLGCLACGMTVAAAAKVAGLGIVVEARLLGDARFRLIVRASAAHLATIANKLPRDDYEAGKVIQFPRRQVEGRNTTQEL